MPLPAVLWTIASGILNQLGDVIGQKVDEKYGGWIMFLAAVFARGEPTQEDLEVAKMMVELWTKEDRAPTTEEMDAVRSSAADWRERLRKAAGK